MKKQNTIQKLSAERIKELTGHRSLVKSEESCEDFNMLYHGAVGKINRLLRNSHVNSIIRSYQKNGVEPETFVLYITKALGGGEKIIIADGQHRFDAHRQLGIPFSYKMYRLKNDTLENLQKAIGVLNSNQKPWKPFEYLHNGTTTGTKYEANYKIFAKYFNHSDKTRQVKIDTLRGIFNVSIEEFNSLKMDFDKKVLREQALNTLIDITNYIKENGKGSINRTHRGVLDAIKLTKHENHSKLKELVFNAKHKFSRDDKAVREQLIDLFSSNGKLLKKAA